MPTEIRINQDIIYNHYNLILFKEINIMNILDNTISPIFIKIFRVKNVLSQTCGD